MGNEPFITPELKRCLNGKLGLNGSFTKGGAAKRVFKPTIPTTRRSTRGSEGINDKEESDDQNSSCNGKLPNGRVKGKEKSNKAKGKKELIQLDATFNGINITSPAIKTERISPGGSGFGKLNEPRTFRSSQTDSPTGSAGTSSINDVRVKLENDGEPFHSNIFKDVNMGDYGNRVKKVEEPEEEIDVETIQRALYRDDFISNRGSNEEDMAPIGWEFVSQHHQLFKQEFKRDVKPSLKRFDKWASTNDQDKMVLFQLPEMVFKGGDGLVGKLKMYQSGKMELVDTRSGIVYDLLHTDRNVNSRPDDEEEEEEDDDGNDNDSDDSDDESSEKTYQQAEVDKQVNKLSTDWIKKEVEEDEEETKNFGFLAPPPQQVPSRPSTSKSSSSSISAFSSSSSSFSASTSSAKSKNASTSKSRSSSKNFHANLKNFKRNNCDKDEIRENDFDSTDEDDDGDEERNINQPYREACTFDGDQIVCLGPISNNDLLIGRPRIDKFYNL